MKEKRRLFFYMVLAILLLLMMAYSFTGGLLHEILGMILLVGLLIHLFTFRKYYGAMAKAIRRRRTKLKNKIAFIVNIILLATVVIMLVSSFAISHELFPAISNAFGGYNIWVSVHVVCAITMLVCSFIHVCLHGNMIMGAIKKTARNPKVVLAWKAGMRVTAVVLAILIIKASVDNAANLSETLAASTVNTSAVKEVMQNVEVETKETEIVAEKETTTAEQTSEEITASEQTEDVFESDEAVVYENEYLTEDYPEEDYAIAADDGYDFSEEEIYVDEYQQEEPEEIFVENEPEPEAAAVSLNDFLGAMTCTGCGKHCSLLSPRCGKGDVQASQATEEYYSIYGV